MEKQGFKTIRVDSFFWSDATWLERKYKFYLFNLELVYLFTYEVDLPTLAGMRKLRMKTKSNSGLKPLYTGCRLSSAPEM